MVLLKISEIVFAVEFRNFQCWCLPKPNEAVCTIIQSVKYNQLFTNFSHLLYVTNIVTPSNLQKSFQIFNQVVFISEHAVLTQNYLLFEVKWTLGSTRIRSTFMNAFWRLSVLRSIRRSHGFFRVIQQHTKIVTMSVSSQFHNSHSPAPPRCLRFSTSHLCWPVSRLSGPMGLFVILPTVTPPSASSVIFPGTNSSIKCSTSPPTSFRAQVNKNENLKIRD